jgi:LAGLIDADG DNA endonuclease family
LQSKYANQHFSLNCKSFNTLPKLKKEFHTITNKSKLKSDLRIGPHNLDVISVLIGSILGDTHLEKRKKGIGTRIIFEQSNLNVEYLM